MKFIFLSILLYVSCSLVQAQNCPDDINNSPGNSPGAVTADVYDGDGNVVQTINCEATGNSNQIDCDLASYNFPSDHYILIELTNGSNTTTCVYDASGELMPINPLPVELIELSGKNIDGYHEINWTTASELNNSHYTLYCSYDGESWSSIGEVEGAGSTSSKTFYSFGHRPEFPGVVYYKVIQHDFDGGSKNLGIISLIQEGIGVSVEHNEIAVNSEQPIKSISVISSFGRVIDSYGNIHDSEFSFAPSTHKCSQLLIVVVETKDGELMKKKILY